MAKKKKAKQDSRVVTAYDYPFQDGPMDVKKLRLSVPPPWEVRLAFPEWSTYTFDRDTGSYLYQGSEPLPTVSGGSTWINGDYLVRGWAPPGNISNF